VRPDIWTQAIWSKHRKTPCKEGAVHIWAYNPYLAHRAKISRARGPLFLSESRRNCAKPLTPWTWSKVIRRIALTAGVPRFGTHTLRHLCLTDLARAGWELHAIATFAGHRHPATTLQYIHLSGRELSAKLAHGMAQIHEWRVAMLAAIEPAGHA
jgi:integrase/recombinase XerD